MAAPPGVDTAGEGRPATRPGDACEVIDPPGLGAGGLAGSPPPWTCAFTLGSGPAVAVPEPPIGLAPLGGFIKARIRSTIAGSRLARALTLTSRPAFWMRSRSSGLFRPSSLASSCTRIDKGNSSRM
jgi:hypothetical protein